MAHFRDMDTSAFGTVTGHAGHASIILESSHNACKLLPLNTPCRQILCIPGGAQINCCRPYWASRLGEWCATLRLRILEVKRLFAGPCSCIQPCTNSWRDVGGGHATAALVGHVSSTVILQVDEATLVIVNDTEQRPHLMLRLTTLHTQKPRNLVHC